MQDKTLAGLRLIQSKNNTIADLRSALREAEEEIELLNREASPVVVPPIRAKLTRSSTRASASSFILGLTDNHFTQLVNSETAPGNFHNETVSRERLAAILDKAEDIVEKAAGVNEVLIWLGGDFMVNADLHPHFHRLTPYEPLEELGVCEGIMLDIFERILDGPLGVKKIRVHGSLSNHGRDKKKEEVSAENAFRRSYDAVLYRHLEKLLPIPVHAERTYWGVEEVGGVKSLLHHGHRLTMKDDPSGLIIPNWSALNRRISHPRHRGTQLYMQGHYHTASELISEKFTFVSAGSTVGDDGYAYDLLFPPTAPSQPLVEIRDGKVIAVHRLEC